MANVPIPIRFQIFKGDQLVREETLNEPVIKIGKLASSHLRLDDETVSRMHAVVEVTGPGEIQLIDLGSTRGTMVNGERINKAVLKSGDQIHFGDTRVVVSFGAAAAAQDATPVMAAVPMPAQRATAGSGLPGRADHDAVSAAAGAGPAIRATASRSNSRRRSRSSRRRSQQFAPPQQQFAPPPRRGPGPQRQPSLAPPLPDT